MKSTVHVLFELFLEIGQNRPFIKGRTISGSSGQYSSSPRVSTPNRYRGNIAGISEAELRELMDMNEEDLFIDSNDNMNYLQSPDNDIQTPQRGRTRTNKSYGVIKFLFSSSSSQNSNGTYKDEK